METQTRFDLDAAVANWQKELAGQPELTPIVRRELETHLRDTITDLQKRGLGNEESFWLARRRVGQPSQLSEEFAKSDPASIWRERVFWIVAAFLIITLWGTSLSMAFGLAFGSFIKWKPADRDMSALYSLVFQILFRWGPIFIGCVLLAQGRFNFRSERWNRVFHSRLGIGILAGAWALANSLALIWMFKRTLSWAYTGIDLLQSLIWPCLLTALLVWLTPKRKMSLSRPA